MTRFLACLTLALLAGFARAEPAPAFSLTDEKGKPAGLGDYTGRTLVLYFLSFQCPHCKTIQSRVNDLHREASGRYRLLGVVFSTPKNDLAKAKEKAGAVFPVAAGNKAIREAYGVPGTPYFALVDRNGRLAERFSGEIGAAVLQHALRACAVRPEGLDECLTRRTGLAELAVDPARHAGQTLLTGGILTPASATYFPQARFLLTNGQHRVAVSAWLPLEVAPTPPQTKKRAQKPVMSDLLGRYVTVEGTLRVVDGKPRIEVARAVPSEVNHVTSSGGK